MFNYDVIVVGAGAAGMMCSIEAGKRNRKVLLLDHSSEIGQKIRISGGGRCNFTNIHTDSDNFLSNNPHFSKSALTQYGPDNFINLVEKYNIDFHEKKLGQMFCNNSAQNIIDMLLNECKLSGIDIKTSFIVENVKHEQGLYCISNGRDEYFCNSLVIATGGLSIPKTGATGFGYDIARQFGLKIVETRPGLVPFTTGGEFLSECNTLRGISMESRVSDKNIYFDEGILFTHKGLSGPTVLQISSYWRNNQHIWIDFAPHIDVLDLLKQKRDQSSRQDIESVLANILPRRFAHSVCNKSQAFGRIAELSDNMLAKVAGFVNRLEITPTGTEGYVKAEVTLGGVDTNELSSKTMESRKQRGLFFIGEVVDVTGHLGGYNFQWAWSSGYVAGQHV